MNGPWLIPVVLGIWLAAGLVVGLLVCPAIRRNAHPLDSE